MYCKNCGTRLPGDANFCPSCGKKIDYHEESVISQAAKFMVNKDTDQLIAESGMTDIIERQGVIYGAALGNAPVYLETVQEAERLLQILEPIKSTNAIAKVFYEELLPYSDVKIVFGAYQERWKEGLSPGSNLLYSDFSQFLYGGLRKIMTNIPIIDKETQERILSCEGIVHFTEQVLLTHLMICMKAIGIIVSPEQKRLLVQQHGENLVNIAFARFEVGYKQYEDHAKQKMI